MSKKANPTLIGGFVFGAAALVVAGLLLFGGGQFLSPKASYVMYFSGSVSGLNVGAPVNFRGVAIGKVTDVEVELDIRDAGIRTPVSIEIEQKKFRTVGGTVEEQDVDRILDVLVSERGLRAKLLSESLVTGLKAVEFDFFPDTPIRLMGVDDDRELPTLPSEFEQLTAELTGLPIAELAASTQAVMQGLNLLVSSPDLQNLPGEVSTVLTELRTLLRNVDERVGELTTRLTATSDGASEVLRDVQGLIRDEDGPILTLTSDLRKTSETTRSVMQQAERTLATLEGTVEGTSDLQYELAVTLREFTAAARAVRLLAESLEQNPESLLRGKKGSP